MPKWSLWNLADSLDHGVLKSFARGSNDQKEDILGELSASITHLRIQSVELDKRLEEM